MSAQKPLCRCPIVPDESLQDGVPCVGHHAGVSFQSGSAASHVFGNSLPPVVPSLVRHCSLTALYCVRVGKLSDVPQLNALVFAVGDQVSSVPPGVNISDSINMT